MVQARKVRSGEVTDFVVPEKQQKELKWQTYLPHFEDAEVGTEIEFSPEGDETSRAVSMNASRAAHQLGFIVTPRVTQRGTVHIKIEGTGWEPKPKRDPNAPPSPRGRKPKNPPAR